MAPKEENKPDDFQQQGEDPTTENNSSSVAKKGQLRICCYGSSSSRTQERYTNDACHLGHTLIERGHTCVNGAGRFGCMGALNRGTENALARFGSSSSCGRVVGVVHEMFIKKDFADGGEGGNTTVGGNEEGRCSDWLETKCAPVFSTQRDGEHTEIHVAGGNDLQERKRMLVDGADALIVMPGGPGTFDELWEMACSKQLGIIDMPIVCVNIDGYYDPFYSILQRAHDDGFLQKNPDDIVHFEPTSEKALDWIEKKILHNNEDDGEKKEEEPPQTLPASSSSSLDDKKKSTTRRRSGGDDAFLKYLLVFTGGLALGGILATASKKK